MSRQTNPSSYDEMKLRIARQRLSQEKISFRLAMCVNIVCFLISLGGWGLLISGKVPQGVTTSTAGMVSSAGFFKIAKDSSDRLDNILTELDD